jgi:NAD(P)H-dependent flavin oxidoreductase YrpB (nitropropane dioxygenase family)
MFLHTPLCDLLDVRYPILQAGMAHVATPELAAAVSAAGGLGVLAAAAKSGDELAAEIRAVRARTDRPFGVDLIVPSDIPEEVQLPPGYQPPAFLADVRRELGLDPAGGHRRPLISAKLLREHVEVVFAERVPVLVFALGDPAPLVPRARQLGVRVMALVGNVRAARKVAAAGVDAVIAQGTEGGGHTGRVGTMALVPQVVDAVRPLPVVAAGGIADGRGLLAALMLGAVGVWLGTRFLAAAESGAHENWRQRVVAAGDDDTVVTPIFTGKPVRTLRNRFLELWEQSGVPALPMPYQGYLIEDIAEAARAQGRTDLHRLGCGQSAGLIHEVRPAAEIVAELVRQAAAIWAERAPWLAGAVEP